MKHLLHSHSSRYYAANALRVLFISDEALEIRLAVAAVSQPEDELVDLGPHALRRRRHRANPANLQDAFIDTSQLTASHERKHRCADLATEIRTQVNCRVTHHELKAKR